MCIGTRGGPLLRAAPAPGDHGYGRSRGICTAVTVDGNVYLVDVGRDSVQGFADAGLHMRDLRAVFVTHHHSDHTVDLNSLMLLGGLALRGAGDRRIPIVGPSPRGSLLPAQIDGGEGVPDVIFADEPGPGTARMVELLLRAHATDLNDRHVDSGAPNLARVFTGRDVFPPDSVGYDANGPVAPPMDPMPVFQDDHVTVTAILVEHPPMSPAFAYRFDTVHGSVVISGDTARTENIVRLAAGADLLLHEAIDLDLVAQQYPGASAEELAASMAHHRRAHTPVSDAVELARQAGVRTLALHHLVPGSAPDGTWDSHAGDQDGLRVVIPHDGDVFTVGSDA